MIETSRLLIRPFLDSDSKEFFQLSHDKGFTLFPITIYVQENEEAAREWIRNNPYKFAVREKSSGELIGMGGLTPWEFDGEELTDITYRLRESAWGKGYGMELAQALVKHGTITLKLKNLTATITPDNLPSNKIAAKLGFKFDQTITLKGVPTNLHRL
jgi:ribosomal-protein-alanine N-acetyltransferase